MPDRSFVLAADGSGLGGPVTFGWSFQMPNAGPSGNGMTIAGDPATCSHWDGTIWDPHPTGPEEGTGMGNLDQFRSDGVGSVVPGCYWFGGNPHGGFRLELFADNACAPAPGTDFCAGDGSGTACPCSNDSAPGSGQGCRNSTGSGASLDSLGTPSVGHDTLTLRVSSLPAASVALFVQGTTQVNGGAGAVFGDGLSCVGGTMTQLVTRFAENGSGVVPESGETRISVLGSIPAGGGVTRYYQAHYRNSESFCTASTFNYSNGHQIVWTP